MVQTDVLVDICEKDNDRYVYGFNGQLKTNEWAGIGNFNEFSERGQDTRVGRFLAVDPIANQYPWNSVYAFAENDVIRCKDLEGRERLNVIEEGAPGLGKPGHAKITISMEYTTVTAGEGAVQKHYQPNPKEFNDTYKKGNSTFFMTSLPSKNAEGVFLEGQKARWAQKAAAGNKNAQSKLTDAGISYYVVDVVYDYTMKVADNVTFNDSWNWMCEDAQGRGLQFNPLSLNKNILSSDAALSNFKNITSRSFDNPNVGGVSTNSKTSNGVFGVYNFTTVKEQNANGEILHASPTSRSIHEAGHNAAEDHRHGTGDYEYNQPGLQNNMNPVPSEENTKSIINDPLNRSTIE